MSAVLMDGKTLQNLTDEAGVAFEDVQSAIQATHEVEIHAIIQHAMDDGTVT